MLSNLHSHTTFCDGKNTPEEMLLKAIDLGFASFGFSSHCYTNFDSPIGVTNLDEYVNHIKKLKEKYSDKIQVYVGIEEDALNPLDKKDDFEYVIGSNHYVIVKGKYYPIDLSIDVTKECLSNCSVLEFAEKYYSTFCDYIFKHKPDIIGHFDLITKFDEQTDNLFLGNNDYNKIAEKYLRVALKSDRFFEVNTGAMSRGYRTSPYPAENLLYILKKEGGKIILSSDTHSTETLDFGFKETKNLLKDIGFQYVYTLYNNHFVKQELI